MVPLRKFGDFLTTSHWGTGPCSSAGGGTAGIFERMNLLARFKDFLTAILPGGKKVPFSLLFGTFQKILEQNNQTLELIAGMGDKMGGSYIFDRQYIITSCKELAALVAQIIYNLNIIAPRKYLRLYDALEKINIQIEADLEGKPAVPEVEYVVPYDALTREFDDVVGSKNANLCEIRNLLGLTTPEGFAITTRAFHSFMDQNQLWDQIASLRASSEIDTPLSEEHLAAKIQQLMMAGTIPPGLERALRHAAERLCESATRTQTPLLAIRSSAVSEDSEHSFAGQHTSFLNELPANLPACFKAVLASTYSSAAIGYRREKGFSEGEVAMAVGCQLTVAATASGVLYSQDPQFPQREIIVISAILGLSPRLMAGLAVGDQYIVTRAAPHEITSLNIVRKAEMLTSRTDGGTEILPVPDDLQTRPCLTDVQVQELAEMALSIERYFKKPMEIEWALDVEGTLFILQARPLNINTRMQSLVCDIASTLKHYPVIFSGKGLIAQRGIATGKAFVVESDDDLNHVPQGAILVTRHTSPRLARVIKKVNGILTDIGSPTGHLATLSREFRVPTIVNTVVATQLLKTGDEITLDAEQKVIYAGTAKELCYYEYTEDLFEETYEYRLLRRVLKKIAPLHLLDPQDKNFVPASCKTHHDILRFVHEKAVEELINLQVHQRANAAARKLKFDIPLGLVVLDIGGGLKEPKSVHEITPDQISSVPMRALLEGMGEPGMWTTEPMSMDFSGFMASLTRTFPNHEARARYAGLNLAVVSKQYANLNLQLGYHFNMIDSYICENINDNYIYFRFLGGGTDLARRSRRAMFLAKVLSNYDFAVEVRGDLVVARIKKLDLESMLIKLRILGRLVAFSRQLDVRMLSDEHMAKFFQHFLELVEMAAQ